MLNILELQDRPPQGTTSGVLPKSLLWSHAISFRQSDDGGPAALDDANKVAASYKPISSTGESLPLSRARHPAGAAHVNGLPLQGSAARQVWRTSHTGTIWMPARSSSVQRRTIELDAEDDFV